MGKLIVNADDFAYTEAISLGIIKAFTEGIITSTTVMANMPSFDRAVQLAKDHPSLAVGVHLNITTYKPLLTDVPSLVKEDGTFHYLDFYEQDGVVSKDDVYREWKAQIERVIHAGIKPSHLDSHHHINTASQVRDVFIELAREFKLPVRNNFAVPADIKTTGSFMNFDQFAHQRKLWKPLLVKEMLDKLTKCGSLEFMCHPGYVDYELMHLSGLNINRTDTLHEAVNPFYKKLLIDNDHALVTFNDI